METSSISVGSRIYTLRDAPIMLDYELAEIYGVETKALKRAVRRNIDRFPDDFMFEPTSTELVNLRCQFGTSSVENSSEALRKPNLRSQIGTSSFNGDTFQHGGTRYAPMVFTELGVAMLSSVLNSEKAIQTNISIMRTFVELRKQPINIDTKTAVALYELKSEMADLRKRVVRIEEKGELFSSNRSLSELNVAGAIMEMVAQHSGVMLDEIKAACRSKAVSKARHLAIYMMRKYLNMSFPEIARHFDRDHTTIIYAYEKICMELERDKATREMVMLIGRALGFC